MCVDDEFSKPFRSYLGEDAFCSFVNSMIEESKYCSDVMKEYFNKEIVMTKKMMKILRTLLNDNDVIMIMLMVMLKLKIIVISLANIELPHLENVKLRLN